MAHLRGFVPNQANAKIALKVLDIEQLGLPKLVSLPRLILRLISEPALRRELIYKEFNRVKHFSWEKAAREALAVYSFRQYRFLDIIRTAATMPVLECWDAAGWR